MALHLIKLSVGCDSIADLEAWIAEKRRMAGGSDAEHVHVTRMMPKRAEALRDGGSLYWIIKGQLSCRQAVIDLRSFTDRDGVERCRIVLDPAVVPIRPRPCRPFQGWRYLDPDDAPPDLEREAGGVVAMPEPLRRELVALGLL